jgi:amino acid transporter
MFLLAVYLPFCRVGSKNDSGTGDLFSELAQLPRHQKWRHAQQYCYYGKDIRDAYFDRAWVFFMQVRRHPHLQLHPRHFLCQVQRCLVALFGAMLSAFWAYDGWVTVSFITGEIKEPKRNVPIALIAGVGIAMTLYVLLNYAFMQVLTIDQLAAIPESKIAAAEVAGVLLGKPGTILISVLIMISTFGALNGCIIVYPRVYYRMAQEQFFSGRWPGCIPNTARHIYRL